MRIAQTGRDGNPERYGGTEWPVIVGVWVVSLTEVQQIHSATRPAAELLTRPVQEAGEEEEL